MFWPCSNNIRKLNIFIPRNTKDQINFVSNKIFNAEEITKGSLIYWPGHVAIALSNDTIIHSNAFHMRVSIENFREVNKRISKQYGHLLKIKKFVF